VHSLGKSCESGRLGHQLKPVALEGNQYNNKKINRYACSSDRIHDIKHTTVLISRISGVRLAYVIINFKAGNKMILSRGGAILRVDKYAATFMAYLSSVI
jgi:hypothetical protein